MLAPELTRQMGREEPAISMDNSGKVIWSRHQEVQQAILGRPDEASKDGEPLTLAVKDLGSCEIFPNILSHNPTGRLVFIST